jgi:hypothetical protein
MFRDCRFCKEGSHPLLEDIADEVVDRCIAIINKGVIALSGHQGEACQTKNSKGVMAASRTDFNAPWVGTKGKGDNLSIGG